MTIAITHAFQSAKGDGADATLVRPSNWNASHATSMATGAVIGRQTAGIGAFEELTLTAFMAAALAATDAPSLLAALGIGAFETGDVKFSIQPTAATGWLAYNGEGTIGDATSGGTVRANADCSALYQLIYNQISDAICPVTGGRGANAITDFNAHKAIALPRFSGRAVIGAGTGSGLTARILGAFAGEENHVLTTAELASHFHTASISDPTHTHSLSQSAAVFAGGSNNNGGGGGAFGVVGNSGFTNMSSNATGVRVNSSNGLDTVNSTGSGTAHNTMQPYVPMWAKVKL
jgi:microcystin-dependent protein